MLRFSRLKTRTAFAAAAALGFLTLTAARAAPPVPSGAATSLPALRQAYLDAVKARKPEALAALFDISDIPPGDRASFEKEKFGNIDQVVGATIIEPDQHVLAMYKENHVALSRPVVKMMKIDFSVPAGESLTTKYLIAAQDGRYFFILASPGR